MPIYEYECEQGHRSEHRLPYSQSSEDNVCPKCRQVAKRVISRMFWHMGWKFLKDRSEKSPPAPTDAGYYPEWDQAYSP